MGKDDHIESLEGLFALLERLELQEETLFRGQRQDFPLLPKIARENLRLKDPVLAAEKAMFDSFKRQAVMHVGHGSTFTDWDWLSIAQHHGLPTRLLDWTRNPLASLWFAVNCEPHDDDAGILWIYQPTRDDYCSLHEKLSPFEVQKPQVYLPNHSAQRIAAQTGLFTVHAYFEAHGGFVPFEDNGVRGGQLQRFEIPADAFCNLRFDLDRCGVNSASIFPDLDGLTSHIQWLHRLLEDEVEAHEEAVGKEGS